MLSDSKLLLGTIEKTLKFVGFLTSFASGFLLIITEPFPVRTLVSSCIAISFKEGIKRRTLWCDSCFGSAPVLRRTCACSALGFRNLVQDWFLRLGHFWLPGSLRGPLNGVRRHRVATFILQYPNTPRLPGFHVGLDFAVPSCTPRELLSCPMDWMNRRVPRHWGIRHSCLLWLFLCRGRKYTWVWASLGPGRSIRRCCPSHSTDLGTYHFILKCLATCR